MVVRQSHPLGLAQPGEPEHPNLERGGKEMYYIMIAGQFGATFSPKYFLMVMYWNYIWLQNMIPSQQGWSRTGSLVDWNVVVLVGVNLTQCIIPLKIKIAVVVPDWTNIDGQT